MKIFKFCSPQLLTQKLPLTIYVTIILSSAVIGILSPYIIGSFLDNLIAGADVNLILRFSAIFGSLGILRIVVNYAASMIYVKMQTQMAYNLNSQTIRHMQSLSLTHSNNSDSAYLNNRINSDSNSLIAFCIGILQSILTNVVMLVVPFVILLGMNVMISLFMLGFLAVFIVSYTLFRKPLYNASFALKESQSKFIASLFEQIKFIKIIKLNSIRPQMNKKADMDFADVKQKAIHNQRINYLYSGMDGFISTVAQILLFVVGGIQIINGNFTIGMFTIFTSYFNLMLGASRYFFGLGAAYQNVLVAYDRMNGLLDITPEGNGSLIVESVNSIELRNVGFKYQETTNGAVLEGVNASFTKGNIYAVAGVNGTGKSTLASLVMGMYINVHRLSKVSS